MYKAVLPISDPSATRHYRASSLSRWRGAWQSEQCTEHGWTCVAGDAFECCTVCPFDRSFRGTFDAHKMHWTPPLRKVSPWNRRREERQNPVWWRIDWLHDVCYRIPDALCAIMECEDCASYHGDGYLTPDKRRKRCPTRP